jgi:DNA-directed RNA polymerase subunit M/transcription elongation factor TFIIS
VKFCQKCDARLIPIDESPNKLFCPKCGYAKTHKQAVTSDPPVTGQRLETVVVISPEEEKLRTMPAIRSVCPKCDNRKAHYRTIEVGEEEETVEVQVFKCTRCGHSWRERG